MVLKRCRPSAAPTRRTLISSEKHFQKITKNCQKKVRNSEPISANTNLAHHVFWHMHFHLINQLTAHYTPYSSVKLDFFFILISFFFSVQKRLTNELLLLFELLLTLHEKRFIFTQIIFYIQIDTRMTGDYSPTCAKFLPFFQFPRYLPDFSMPSRTSNEEL